jgi:hypothetical protein
MLLLRHCLLCHNLVTDVSSFEPIPTILKCENCLLLPRVEAGSNTSTIALRVVGDDEKGSHESETVKYGHESHGTQTRE